MIASVDPAKDVDGFHPLNAGRLAAGLPALVPCTPMGCIKLAKTVHTSLAGLEAVVVGRSNIVGKPLLQLLLAAKATVTAQVKMSAGVPARPVICSGAMYPAEPTVIPVLVMLAVSKDQVKDAPNIESGEQLSENEQQALRQYYSV